MSTRTIFRTGLALGSQTVPRLLATTRLGVCLLAIALYLVLRGR